MGCWFVGVVELISCGVGWVLVLMVNSGIFDLRNVNIIGVGGGNGGFVDLSFD